MKRVNGVLLPDVMLTLDPAKAGVTERERVDLIQSMAKILRGLSLPQMHTTVTNMRNAMGASLPGTVSVAEAAAVTIAAAAELSSIFLEQLGEAAPEQAEGHIQACREVFEQVMRSRRSLKSAMSAPPGVLPS